MKPGFKRVSEGLPVADPFLLALEGVTKLEPLPLRVEKTK